MTKNTESTRYYSDKQEKAVCKLVGGYQTSNSGAGDFSKGDIIVKDASLLLECKTQMTNKDSFSIKKKWLETLKKEQKEAHLDNSILTFSFGPDSKNYFIIEESMVQYLVDKLREDG